MYMIGQLATLRSDIASAAELHRDVSEGSRLETPEPLARQALDEG